MRQAGATLHRGARASHCRGLSCCGAQAPDTQAQQLWLTGLVAAACGIFPDQGSNPCPLHWQADSQPLRHQGSPWDNFFKTNLIQSKSDHEQRTKIYLSQRIMGTWMVRNISLDIYAPLHVYTQISFQSRTPHFPTREHLKINRLLFYVCSSHGSILRRCWCGGHRWI